MILPANVQGAFDVLCEAITKQEGTVDIAAVARRLKRNTYYAEALLDGCVEVTIRQLSGLFMLYGVALEFQCRPLGEVLEDTETRKGSQ